MYHRSATPARASDADNQRADLVGCAGNSIIETPNLDLLGYRGVRFANAFATTPVCAASRASYLTGLYERRRRFTFQTPPLRREFSDISYPALLRAAGYHTGFIGKFGIAVNGIEPSLQDAGDLERMFDHFDSYEHWTDEGYEIHQPDGTIRHLTDITGDKAVALIARQSAGRHSAAAAEHSVRAGGWRDRVGHRGHRRRLDRRPESVLGWCRVR